MARLLPKSTKLCGPGLLAGIDPVWATSVFAVGAAIGAHTTAALTFGLSRSR